MKNLLLSLLLLAVLAGCAAHRTTDAYQSQQIDVFGVQLGSSEDYRTLKGVTATEEPCLKGYERSFDALKLTIAYGFDKRVKRIATRHPETAIFGIRPGMKVAEGRQRAVQAGLAATDSPDRFRGDGFFVVLLVDDNDTVFGVTLEAAD